MYKSVEMVLASNSSIWTGIQAFTNAHDNFIAKLVELRQLSFEQDSELLGVKDVKDRERIETAEKAWRIAGSLRSLAYDSKDTVLKARMKFAASELRYSNVSVTLELLERVRTAATDHAPELVERGILQADIDDYVDSCDRLTTAFGTTRNAILNRKEQTKQITDHIREIDDLLKNNLDQLVEVQKKAHPKFVARYHSARMVIDHPGKKNNPLDPGAATMPPLLPEGPGELDL